VSLPASLILASASPRRRELLAAAGYRFRTEPASIPERRRRGETAEAMALRLATEKARRIASGHARGIVLGADTLVVLEGRPLGKPPSTDAAVRMLRSLSGRTHSVVTGVALIDAATGREVTGLARSSVAFRALDPGEIRAYVATGEPLDKAGAYAIQGGAGAFVASFRGSRSNIVGLPMELLARLLRGFPAGDGALENRRRRW
jgi:septum formation protein